MPNLRLAINEDIEAIHTIVMSDHVNPFMSFEQLDLNSYRPLFELLSKQSDIYVLENDDGQVVATRRLIFGEGERAHCVEFASFGVHKDHLGKGYGSFFYKAFLQLLKEQKPNIICVVLTQETDNEVAFDLAKRKGFEIEAMIPEYLRRETGPQEYKNKWYVGERFLKLFLDQSMKEQSKDEVKPFIPQLPDLISTELNNVNSQSKFEIEQIAGVRRGRHIQTWSIRIDTEANLVAVESSLRQLAVEASQNFKKIEISTSNQTVLNLLQKLGFHYRGKTIASIKVKDTYYNEAIADFNFFNITDAKEMLSTLDEKEAYKICQAKSALTICEQQINNTFTNKKIDQFGRLYLENLAFQMTREKFSETYFYEENNTLWAGIIEALPEPSLQEAFIKLATLLFPNFSINSQIVNNLSRQLTI